jgi:hypothetical protein
VSDQHGRLVCAMQFGGTVMLNQDTMMLTLIDLVYNEGAAQCAECARPAFVNLDCVLSAASPAHMSS